MKRNLCVFVCFWVLFLGGGLSQVSGMDMYGDLNMNGNDILDVGDVSGRVSQNLLTNSGFGVWSNSEGLYDVSAQITLTDITSGVATTSGAHGLPATDVGTLWEFDAGDFDTEVYEITAIGDTTHFTLNDTSLTDSGTPGTGHTVTPGIVSTTTDGPDGWGKNNKSTVKIYRMHSDGDTEAVTKLGSFYALKLVNTRTAAGDMSYQGPGSTVQSWYSRFAGRTVTFGAWVNCDTASEADISIYQTSGETSSGYHSGTPGWEWLEVTATIADNTTIFVLYMGTEGSAATTTTYFSQPQLSFGSSLGEGNYSQPPGEVVWGEAAITATDYSNDDLADDAINLEAQSDGKIPKGAKAVYLNVTGTGTGATDKVEFYKSSSKVIGGVVVNVDGTNPGKGTGWQPCDSSGDIYVDETGTVTAVTLKIIGVQVN